MFISECVVLLGWCDGVERHSFQLEVRVVESRHADILANVHGQPDERHRSSLAAVAWHWQH